jgi:sulfite reductase beta subunit-like hemoprotein
VAEAVVTTQGDYDDRSNRKLAKLKYTIERQGLAAANRQLHALDAEGRVRWAPTSARNRPDSMACGANAACTASPAESPNSL